MKMKQVLSVLSFAATALALGLVIGGKGSLAHSVGVREVSASSCEVVRLNLGLGITTQVVFEQEPKVTLYADHRHFRINTNSLSPRSLAIIPFVEANELNAFRDAQGRMPTGAALAQALDKSFKTNLFVFFDNNNQLMFQLRFVDKAQADYIVRVKQVFKEDCVL